MKKIFIEIHFGENVIFRRYLYIEEKALPALIDKIKSNESFINYLKNNHETEGFLDILEKNNINSKKIDKILEIYFFRIYSKKLKFNLSILI